MSKTLINNKLDDLDIMDYVNKVQAKKKEKRNIQMRLIKKKRKTAAT